MNDWYQLFNYEKILTIFYLYKKIYILSKLNEMEYLPVALSSGGMLLGIVSWNDLCFSLLQNYILCSTEMKTIAYKFYYKLYFKCLVKNSYLDFHSKNIWFSVLLEGEPGFYRHREKQASNYLHLFKRYLPLSTFFYWKIIKT